MKKLDIDALSADRMAVLDLLENLPDGDLVGRSTFEARLGDIDRALGEVEHRLDTTGSVALLFAGSPVHGARSIDSVFATRAISVFQDLVTKEVAMSELGSLGGRGPVPKRAQVNLAISELVRGSLGFVLEENCPSDQIADTVTKIAIDDVTRLLERTASENDADFEEAVETLDSRLLVSLKDFFTTLDDFQATVRIVESAREASFDPAAVHRGRVRMDSTKIEEKESESLIGELLGLLPESRRFEMRLRDSVEIIKGNVAAQFAADFLGQLESGDEPILGRQWRVKMKIREVAERNKPVRNLYTLVGLLERADPEGRTS